MVWESKFNSGQALRSIKLIALGWLLVIGQQVLGQTRSASWSVSGGVRPPLELNEPDANTANSWYGALSYLAFKQRRHAIGAELSLSQLSRSRELYQNLRPSNYTGGHLSGIYRYYPLNEPQSGRFLIPYVEANLGAGFNSVSTPSIFFGNVNYFSWNGMTAVGVDFSGSAFQLGLEVGAGIQQIPFESFAAPLPITTTSSYANLSFLHVGVNLSWPARARRFNGPALASYHFPEPSTYLPKFNPGPTLDPLTVDSALTVDTIPEPKLVEPTLVDTLQSIPPDSLNLEIEELEPLTQDSIPAPKNIETPVDSVQNIPPDTLNLEMDVPELRTDSLGVPPEETSLDSLNLPPAPEIIVTPPIPPDSSAVKETEEGGDGEGEIEIEIEQEGEIEQEIEPSEVEPKSVEETETNSSSTTTSEPSETQTVLVPTPVVVNTIQQVTDTVVIRDTLFLPAPVLPQDSSSGNGNLDSLPLNSPGSLKPGTQGLLTDMDSLEMALLLQENKLLRDEVIWLRENQDPNKPDAVLPPSPTKADTVFIEVDRTEELNALNLRLRELEDSLAKINNRPVAASIQELQHTIYYSNGRVQPSIQDINDLLEKVNGQLSSIESINVSVYTDSQGSVATNLSFAKRRAEYLKNELVKAGVPVTKISTYPYGEQFAKKTVDPKDRKAVIDVRFRDN